MVLDWTQATINALLNLWVGFLGFLPSILGAVLVLLVGWFFAGWVGRFAAELLKRLKFDQLFSKDQWKEALRKADVRITPAEFLGAIVKWALAIVFLSAASEVLGLNVFAGFLGDVVAFIPHVFAAVLILVATVVIVDIVEKVLRIATEGMQMGYGHGVGIVVRWAIWIFAIIAILNQLRMDTTIFGDSFKIILQGIVFMLALAGGLAFGLGGKEVASQMLDDLKKRLRP